jgi:RNA polymerase sigma factor (sigma-70 family)
MLDEQLVTLVKSFLARRKGARIPEETCACEEFARTCAPIIRAKMRRVHDPRHEIDDLVQDVWVLLLRKLPDLEFDPLRAPITAWVSTIAERHARKRARRRWNPFERSLNETRADTLVDPGPSPGIAFEWMQEHESFQVFVAKFAASMSELDRRVVVMHWIEGCSLSKIALDLNMTESAVWWVIRRTKPKLLDYLRRSDFGTPRKKIGRK